MQTQFTGLAAPLDIANVDTDAIIPKQFLQKVTRTGFGQHLFHDWRFLDDAGSSPNPDFILNQPRYRAASVLLARENFGCGSSREHALWALKDYGIDAIIAPNFADIFYSNAINNQLIPVSLSTDEIDELFAFVTANQGAKIALNLEQLTITANKKTYPFYMDSFHQHCLLHGLDHIDLTLQQEKQITEFEANIASFLR